MFVAPPPVRVLLRAGIGVEDDGDEPKSVIEVLFRPRLRLRLSPLLLLRAAVDRWLGDTGRNKADPARPAGLLTDGSRDDDAAAEVAARRALAACVVDMETVLSRDGETEGCRRCGFGGRC